MIGELGHFALILALVMALLLTFVPTIGIFTHNNTFIRTASALAFGTCFFVLVSYLSLTEAFINNDFSLLYVANNSNSQLPLPLRISAVWGGHEGSLLLWLVMLSGWTASVALSSSKWDVAQRARVLSVLGIIITGFLLFILLTSNPFARLLPFFPTEGRDLNPLLQDFALIIHPPTLYMGYVGFAIAFALAIAALWEGKMDNEWAKRALPWTLFAWLFLTLGIMLGSWWAYYELGWGGWWFWDPVENASLMPWLIGTALIHSLLATSKRGIFKSWTALLAILAFSLSLLGTFLVRSGVLTSVHAFANDPERGLFILGFLMFVVGFALALFAWRAKELKTSNAFHKLSRESFLLANNIILIVACAIILLATLYPLILDALNAGQISVGAPYFNVMFVPLFTMLLFLMGFAPFTRWKGNMLAYKKYQCHYLLIISIVAGVLLYFFSGHISVFIIIGFAVSIWLIISTLDDLFSRIYTLKQMKFISRNYYGMVIAHLGVAITALGITLSTAYSIDKDIRIVPGENIVAGPYTFTFTGVRELKGPNYQAVQGEFIVTEKSIMVAKLYPERRINNSQRILTTKTAIDPGLFRDLYVALGESLQDQSWAVRVHYKPFIRWIWLGAILMAIGGLIAAIKPKRQSQ